VTSLEQLGDLIKAHRELRKLTQDQVVGELRGRRISTNRSAIAHLEQGLRLPKTEVVESLCVLLGLPPRYWAPFLDPAAIQRFEFEEVLSELVGTAATLDGHDKSTTEVVQQEIAALFRKTVSDSQTYDRFNSILVAYGGPQVSVEFFSRYLGARAFGSLDALRSAVKRYQLDAIRLFSTFTEAFARLNALGQLEAVLAPLQSRSLSRYTERDDWDAQIEIIPEHRLADLGYASAPRLRQEAKERGILKLFLEDLAAGIRATGRSALVDVPPKTRNRMDSLLRKFESKFSHGLLSPLFAPEPDELLREANRLAPKSEDELRQLEETQRTATKNLARYLAADHMDVYVATSMRSHADYVSVNRLVSQLFAHAKLRPLKLRYFNPTQSWVEDRIAKGLVEALMLRRAEVTLYMAQKVDTFGKDSEASVALGQGKPVIVYAPKFLLEDGTDTEVLFRKPRSELMALLEPGERDDIDDAVDDHAIISRVLESKLLRSSRGALEDLARRHWADFDLRGEAERINALTREETVKLREEYRRWIDAAVAQDAADVDFDSLRPHIVSVFVSTGVRAEERARLFREIHPLALQIILSTGVLNGIVVARTVEQCAEVLSSLLENSLLLHLQKDEHNYRLIETSTSSTIRVISRHRLLRHAFQLHYGARV
jgi:hypothetical protein